MPGKRKPERVLSAVPNVSLGHLAPMFSIYPDDHYPSSMKNLKHAVRKKAIDIGNSMIDEGYDENRAIPIATQQAKEWYENADKEEIREKRQMMLKAISNQAPYFIRCLS